VVDAEHADATVQTLRDQGETVYRIGRIAGRGEGAAVEVR
jgi:phosphoribosylformylglycinamidine cyclo-ligase